MEKKIIMNVSDDGEIKIETKGFKGKSCLQSSEFLETALGNELHRQLTPAYFEFDNDPKKSHTKILNLCG